MGYSIENFIYDLERLKVSLPTEAERLIKGELKEQIIDLNREDQLFNQGIDSNGKFLGYYSSFTIMEKKQRGLPYNRTTLFDSGDFYNGFDLLISENSIRFFSRDSKTLLLQDKYDSGIFGLIKSNAEKMNYMLLAPKLEEFIRKSI